MNLLFFSFMQPKDYINFKLSLETPSRDDAPKTSWQWSGLLSLLPLTWWWPYHLSSSSCLAHSFHHYSTVNVAQHCDLVQYHIYFHASYPCTKPQLMSNHFNFLSQECYLYMHFTHSIRSPLMRWHGNVTSTKNIYTLSLSWRQYHPNYRDH